MLLMLWRQYRDNIGCKRLWGIKGGQSYDDQGRGLWSRAAEGPVLALPLPGCVALGKAFNFSGPWFSRP